MTCPSSCFQGIKLTRNSSKWNTGSRGNPLLREFVDAAQSIDCIGANDSLQVFQGVHKILGYVSRFLRSAVSMTLSDLYDGSQPDLECNQRLRLT